MTHQCANYGCTGLDLSIEWAYGQPRVHRDGGSRDVSPRLPMGQMSDWIQAFWTGWTLRDSRTFEAEQKARSSCSCWYCLGEAKKAEALRAPTPTS